MEDAPLKTDQREQSVEQAIDALKQGKMIIVTDSDDRENEGDLFMCAQDVDAEAVNFMALHARGLICTPLTEERAQQLRLEPMVQQNEDGRRTAFTVSVDARNNISTGISAQDRCTTIQLLVNEDATPKDFVRPGHIFPLIARRGGVLVRAGHTEAMVDLCKLAGKDPVGVICEIMNPDGTMARLPDLESFAEEHQIVMVTIKDLMAYRLRREKIVFLSGQSRIHSKYGDVLVKSFQTKLDDRVHVAILFGEIDPAEPVLVRVHAESSIDSLLGLENPDSSQAMALRHLQQAGSGVFLFIKESSSTILGKLQLQGDAGKIDGELVGYEEQDDRLRNYGIGAQVLNQLGIRQLRLLTNHPRPIVGLEAFDLTITETVSYGRS